MIPGMERTDGYLRTVCGETLRELGIGGANEGDINLIITAHRAGAGSSSKAHGESEDVGELHFELGSNMGCE
jgi:hypothetical protein